MLHTYMFYILLQPTYTWDLVILIPEIFQLVLMLLVILFCLLFSQVNIQTSNYDYLYAVWDHILNNFTFINSNYVNTFKN